ncbi:NGG1p interacting factor NIF3 [Pseudomonas sp. F1_0610]|uniref:NGG1p interacting factor NIF3 n=1 Tax=Pseudomonas sp. F1_0610 TaxID=3114284 RepID=UPI0039C1C45C
MYKLCFYVPDSHLEPVKEAIFAAGAGAIGDYDKCCWQTLGKGQFRPLENSHPFIGTQGIVETVPEWCVEMVVPEAHIRAVIAALKQAHPYETPGYDVLQMVDL